MTDKAPATCLPDAQPIIRTVPQTADLNINGNIFGGWILAQMDLAGGTLARQVAKGPVATVAIEKMKFYQPINLGDIISIYGTVESQGRTSITAKLDVFAEDREGSSARQVTDGRFIFVAIDEDGRPRPLKKD